MGRDECKYLIKLIQCDTESEPCIWTSDSITNLKPRIWNPFCLFYMPIRYLPLEIFATLLLSAWGTEGERKDNMFSEYCKTQAIISKTLHFVCHFQLVISCLCSVTCILSSSFTFYFTPLTSSTQNTLHWTVTWQVALILACLHSYWLQKSNLLLVKHVTDDESTALHDQVAQNALPKAAVLVWPPAPLRMFHPPFSSHSYAACQILIKITYFHL